MKRVFNCPSFRLELTKDLVNKPTILLTLHGNSQAFHWTKEQMRALDANLSKASDFVRDIRSVLEGW